MSGDAIIAYLDGMMPTWRTMIATDEGYKEMQRLPQYPECKACIDTILGYDEGEEFVDTEPYPWGPTGDPGEDKGEWDLNENTLGYWDQTFEDVDEPLVGLDDYDDYTATPEPDDEPLGAD